MSDWGWIPPRASAFKTWWGEAIASLAFGLLLVALAYLIAWAIWG